MTRVPWPQRTTAVAGGILLVCGLLELVMSARLELPITETWVVPLSGPVVSFAAAIARAAAFLVAAVGVAGELGIAAGARAGSTALVLWGLRDLTFLLLPGLPAADPPGAAVLRYAIPALQLVFPVAAVIAAVSVIRARVLSGLAPRVLLVTAIFQLVLAALLETLPFVPDAAQAVLLVLAAAPIEFVEPVLTLLLAVALLLWGRSEAVKHRARVTYDAW